MVGYIDNAVIHSEVRVRFDAAMDDTTPDRAEFFYAKCGCYAFAAPPAYDPRTPGPGPGIPRAVNFQQLHFYGEYAPHPHFSLFVQLPFRWLQPQSLPGVAQAFPSAGGFSDVQLGLKFAPLVSPRHYLTFQFRAYTPTGDAGVGLGTHHYSVEPSLLYYQRLGERAAVEAEVGDTHPIGTSSGVPTAGPNGFAGDVFFYGVGPSYQFVRDEKFGLAGVLEVVGWNVRSGYVTSNRADKYSRRKYREYEGWSSHVVWGASLLVYRIWDWTDVGEVVSTDLQDRVSLFILILSGAVSL